MVIVWPRSQRVAGNSLALTARGVARLFRAAVATTVVAATWVPILKLDMSYQGHSNSELEWCVPSLLLARTHSPSGSRRFPVASGPR